MWGQVGKGEEVRVTCVMAHGRPSAEETVGLDGECFLWWPQVHLVERSRHDLLLAYRCLLHRYPVIPVEGVRHHLGQLSPPLRPQVPAETVLPPQLLEAHFLSCKAAAGPPSGLCAVPGGGRVPCMSCLRWMVQSWLPPEAALRRDGT